MMDHMFENDGMWRLVTLFLSPLCPGTKFISNAAAFGGVLVQW